MKEPFGVLYMLVVPRDETPPGRFQSPELLSREQCLSFLHDFREFLEQDGRHNLWVAAADQSSLIVYDRHNVLYAYGPLAKFEEILRGNGFTENKEVRFPSPHTHHYHAVFDGQGTQLLTYWDWKVSPLRPSDEC